MSELDIVVFGASGSTGELVAREVATNAPAGLRLGIAGRRRRALEPLADELGAELIEADAGDASSLVAMAERTRVVASTVGPYARYGSELVAACVERRAHYVDITGEAPWVRRMIDAHHARAAERGVRIVPFCGFDSIPADLGVWSMVSHWRERGLATARVSSAYKIRGGLGGGTLATALTAAETGDAATMTDRRLLDPQCLAPPCPRQRRKVEHDPRFDAWLAPFFMALINSRVVHRSAALFAERGQPYGEAFAYDESLETRRRTRALGIAGSQWIFDRALRSKVGREIVRRLGPKPGEGPGPEARRSGHVSVRLWAEAEDGQRVLGHWQYRGDPGHAFTSMSCAQSALLLASGEALPGGPSVGGVLTPATALGAPLLARLRREGVDFEINPSPRS